MSVEGHGYYLVCGFDPSSIVTSAFLQPSRRELVSKSASKHVNKCRNQREDNGWREQGSELQALGLSVDGAGGGAYPSRAAQPQVTATSFKICSVGPVRLNGAAG